MIDCGSLEYAQARVQARHGQRVDEATWRRIELVRAISPLLDLARSTALRTWLVGITPDSSAHQVEAGLRARWREAVDEVAVWMPQPWQAPLRWCAVLPDLAPLQHLARGDPAPAWMLDDPLWRELAATAAPMRAARLDSGPWAALAAAWNEPHTLGTAWLANWRLSLPRSIEHGADALTQLCRAMLEHAEASHGAEPGQWAQLRQALRERLALLLRRATLEPALAFIHLALCLLDLQRLRAELLRRLLFSRWGAA